MKLAMHQTKSEKPFHDIWENLFPSAHFEIDGRTPRSGSSLSNAICKRLKIIKDLNLKEQSSARAARSRDSESAEGRELRGGRRRKRTTGQRAQVGQEAEAAERAQGHGSAACSGIKQILLHSSDDPTI